MSGEKLKQDDPTKPQPVDAIGRPLDGWGLPVNGPARAAELEKLGKPDPLIDPAAWAKSGRATATANQD